MPSDLWLESVDPPIAIDLVRHARAKRYSLRYDGVRDRLRLVLPKRGSSRAALRWAKGEAAWVSRQRATRLRPIPFAPGERIPFRGRALLIDHDPAAPRTPAVDGETLRVGGPREGVARRVATFLRGEARRLLSDDVAACCAAAGVTVTGVAVGDARTRWGSCSASGRLRFSWRLVCAPDEVRRYVAAHEVAHRLHMDHSPAFYAAEARLFDGDVAAAKANLRALGPELRRIGA